MDIKQSLEHLGFNNKESKIFEYLIQSIKATPYEISQKTGVSRTTVYRILEKFKEIGIVKTENAGDSVVYILDNPQYFNNLVETQEENLSKMKSSVDKIYSSVSNSLSLDVTNTVIKPIISTQDINNLLKNISNEARILWFYDKNITNEIINLEVLEDFRQILYKNGCKIKQITNNTAINDWTNEVKLVETLWDIRYLPKEIFNPENEILCWDNGFAMYSMKENRPNGVVYFNSVLSNLMNVFFAHVWSNGTKMKIISDRGSAIISTFRPAAE